MSLYYYPFGMPMPNRNIEGNYRYGYQGEFAEKDPETGMEAFELRLWDSRIGRWLITDPYGQYASPYLGMGNNPISLTDPDGGMTDDWYEILDSDGNGTGEYTWIDGSGHQEGYRHVGFFAHVTDAFNNTTFYDGVTQSVYYSGQLTNGKYVSNMLLESHGGMLDEVVVTADIRSFGKKTKDYLRKDWVNPIIRSGSKVGNIIMSQTNVVIQERLHEGNPYNWDNYTFNHYREFDENWNYIKIPLNQSSDLQTITDAISINPVGVELNLVKNKDVNFLIDEAATATIQEGVIKVMESVHSKK